ncbi:MAG: acyl-CoA dehydrogenase family protein [Pseudomonadota bacterium]
MIPRTIFSPEHELFRDSFKKFIAQEITPHHDAWEEAQQVDRALWTKAGEQGFLCTSLPEEFGGSGADRLYSAIIIEELSYAGATGPGFSLHSDIVAPYINNYGTPELKQRYLPKMATGEWIGAIAMTEPGTGSDLQAVKTTAVEDGDDFIINGSKTFITNGYMCDFAIVVAKTGDPKGGADQMSLIIVDAERAGFTKEKPLKKVGMKAQDTCVLHFDTVRVPKTNILGGPNMAFIMLMSELAWERLMIAIGCVSGAQFALDEALKYSKEREAFGRPIGKFQNTKFTLAEMKTKVSMARVFVDRCMELELEKKLDVDDAAAAKYWTSELLCEVVDEAVQIHGGYGYMWEYPIARAYADARVQRIYGGTSEIMKEIISRGM